MRSAYGLDVGPDVDWRDRAACLGHDPELWALIGKETAGNRLAKEICADCPVTQECQELAERTGSWGLIFAGKSYYTPARPATAQWAICGYCMTVYERHVPHARFCSDKCRMYAFKAAESAKRRAAWTH